MGVQERRERERNARKGAVLDAAREMLLEKGFKGATTKGIAERSELSEATLFFYFNNKDEILVSLLFESIDFWAKGLEKIEKSTASAEKKLKQIWRFHEKVSEGHPEYYLLSSYLAQPNALKGVSEEIKERIVQQSGENFQRLARLLEETTGQPDGSHMADTMWATFMGLMILRESRTNLGHAEVRSTKKDRATAFAWLKNGFCIP
ncbi:MAG: TetR/AcrR family transcriptional regulator [Gammaproteobacteria bacterium]|mgnify:CR=1 FL=1|jgi:AcrR family transcriptional regulator|nr:TetR/AcrR family transcriptional regulator [Gammaproteobacteria bacterium]MDP6654147.1 TetR/AcrR family transcriptional regulator [Gammaproteobacteria bacterium]|tara:strand:+ start:1174 stop:1791 length:618 start_codon:yes stop_codon:yes gene_type:complete